MAITGGGGLAVTVSGMTILGAAPELVLAARLVIAGCKTSPALCINKAGIYVADIFAPEAITGTGALAAGSVLVVGKAPDAVKNLAQQVIKTADTSLKNKAFNTQPVADFIKGQTAAGAALSPQTAKYLRGIQSSNTSQLVRLFDPKQSESKLNIFGQQFEQVLGARK
ncbi:hypothetical protein [Klebsiella oxytoca]|uniref:hypothetical protein n=1 Tax=Klebsiella oxytoca TaxID=571 RepID=UPI00157B9C8F|nr:hypothetical protein [Klebsiella oxytoca]